MRKLDAIKLVIVDKKIRSYEISIFFSSEFPLNFFVSLLGFHKAIRLQDTYFVAKAPDHIKAHG